MIYDSTSTAMGILDAPVPTTQWPVETTNDSSPIAMGILDLLVEVVAPWTLEMMDVELATVMWPTKMI
ncbi:hypothetical protein PVL29_006362 [Vitis rotundifolia]|uniref:Uncharacterized protein n=1 Tax=Vitis rotundifolia TaxID=103349 RepID=A0AA39A5W1_VITRO|nr:hypothetical protein PVL29_006362 [Vitis rotundifolia]